MLKVLEFEEDDDYEYLDLPQLPEPHEYLAKVEDPQEHDMTWYVKHAGCIEIREFDKNMHIDCIADKIIIDPDWIQDIKDDNLGTNRFYDSIHAVEIHYRLRWN